MFGERKITFKKVDTAQFLPESQSTHATLAFCEKPTSFLSSVKKIKKYLNKSYCLAPHFMFFTHDTDNIVFCETIL
jgi:hypothetical protein